MIQTHPFSIRCEADMIITSDKGKYFLRGLSMQFRLLTDLTKAEFEDFYEAAVELGMEEERLNNLLGRSTKLETARVVIVDVNPRCF